MFSFSRGRSKSQKQQPKVARRRLFVEQLEARHMLSAVTVTNLNDHGAGSFRQALLDANRNPGTEVINFAVSGVIQLTSGPLPTIMSNVDIEGGTAPGFSGAPKVEVNFHGAGGLQFGNGSAGSTLRSLSLVNAAGSAVTLNRTSGVTIAGNFIGLGLDGTTVGRNTGDGVTVSYSTGDTIGGITAAARNVIAGNGNNGITLNGSSSNTIEGNYIGTDASGTLARANTGNGILLAGISKNNTIGGTQGNLVSGNNSNGILVNGQSSGNNVSGNTIGLAAGGTTALGNRLDGVELQNAASNVIGNSNPVSSTTQYTLSNVISGNGANGIELNAASNNQITMNNIGTDSSGNLARGNGANGILVTAGSANNLIGGEATGGNDPTGDVFVRPPQGNLISGNSGDGVLITGAATANQLSGNYIGTTAGGSLALGNLQNGVAIVNANNNSLIGCNFDQDPFVFYNVISGNGQNGLLVDNSNNTTIQANFFGMGADNQHAVGNALNGVIVEGSSTNTTMGGPIPLGNVDSANGQNGIVVQDTASYFTSYNTFDGLAAFSDVPLFGNGHDGMLITSTGGNILIRTNVITENGNDGVEIGGSATGVRVTGNIIGLNTDGLIPMGNKNNGVEVDGNANGDIIGGPQPTFNVIPQNTIGSNANNGVAIDGTAHNITVSNSFIGTDVTGKAARGNTNDGVYIGPGASGQHDRVDRPTLQTVISGNHGTGVEMNGTTGNTVIGSDIGVDETGAAALGNSGSGVYLNNSSKNTIGSTSSTAPQNIIAFNSAQGVFVNSGTQDGIRKNSIYSNTSLGIDLGSGANLNQAAPVLTSVHAVSGGTQVSGTLTSAPNATFTLDFFASTASGTSGQYLLGTATVTTNASGVATFTFTGTALPSGATYVTATATDANNNTSQFSNALA